MALTAVAVLMLLVMMASGGVCAEGNAESAEPVLELQPSQATTEKVEEFVNQGVPFVIRGEALDWPAVGKWNISWLRNKFGRQVRCICVFVCLCACVCVCVCLCLCLCLCLYLCVCVCLYPCLYLCLSVSVSVCSVEQCQRIHHLLTFSHPYTPWCTFPPLINNCPAAQEPAP